MYPIASTDRLRTHNNFQYEEDKKKAGVALGSMICSLAIGFGIFNLGFIIPSLIFAYQGSPCVTQIPDGFPFNLSTWLQIDAYIRIGIVVLLLIIAIISCCSVTVGSCLLGIFICLIMLYTLFSLAWTIIGAIMFWGKLNPAGYCDGGVQIYMWIFLILSFVGICLNCCSSSFSGRSLKSNLSNI